MTEYSDEVLDDIAEGERQKADELFGIDNDKENIAELPTRWISHCVFCGRELANSDSIEAFAGPICRGKYGSIVDLSLALNPVYDEATFDKAIATASIEIDKTTEKIEISNQILRNLSRGLPVTQAQAALQALEALGYRGLARVVGTALNVKGWNGASLDPASAELANGLIVFKSGYCSAALIEMRAIPGRRWDSVHRLNCFAGTPLAAKMLLALCETWFPFTTISQEIKDLASKATNETAPVIAPPPKKQTSVMVMQNKLEISTEKYLEYFVSELKNRIPNRMNAWWDNTKKVWVIDFELAPIAIEVTCKYYKNVILDPKLEDLKKQVAIQKELATATTVDEKDEIKLFGGKLYPFQSAGVKFLEMKIADNGGVIVGDDMGLGKTMQFLAFVDRNRAMRMPALVVCPANVKLNWARKTMTWLNNGIRCAVIEGNNIIDVDQEGNKIRGSNVKFETITKSPDILITNYDLLKKFKDKLISLKFETVCFDEAHYLKEFSSGRSKAAREISKTIPRKALLTGTLMLNRPRELYHPLHICNPKMWSSFKPFGWRYCGPETIHTRNGTITTFNGATNLDELRDKLIGHFMIRRNKVDVLKDLPEKTVFQTCIDVPKEDRSEYDAARNDFLTWAFKVGGSEKLSAALRAEAVTRLTALKRLSAMAKVKTIAEYCHEWLQSNENEQLLLFGHHTDVMKYLIDVLSVMKYEVVSILGEDNANKRQAAIDSFVSGKARVMIASILAAGVGTDGLQCCQNMKVIERTWRPADMIQMEDRIHRIGQDKPCFVEYLDMENSIDARMAIMVAKKMEVIRQVLDGKAAPEAGDIAMYVYDEMINESQR